MVVLVVLMDVGDGGDEDGEMMRGCIGGVNGNYSDGELL